MATTRAARPVRKPAGATRAPSKTSAAKKSTAKKATKPKPAKACKQELAARNHGASAIERYADLPAATSIALVERITRAVGRELLQIEAIVAGYHVEPRCAPMRTSQRLRHGALRD
jgi:hypothetical protein